MTLDSPPVTVDQLDLLEHEFAPQFSTLKAFVESWQACKTWYADKRYTISVKNARDWFERDLEKDAVNRWQPHDDPLAEAHPQQYDLPSDSAAHFVARGDLHDWSGIEDPDYNHLQHCRRCQLGIESRRIVDERAHAAGKLPFGNLGTVVRRER
jgi:hypothetical protein